MIFLPLFLLIAFPLFSQEAGVEAGGTADEDLFFAENEGLTITGTVGSVGAVKTSQQIAVIEREEIERRNAPNLANLLQETLDVNITSYGAYGSQSGITLRGFDSKRVAFLIDGVPADSAANGKFDIHQIDLNSIERIEVIYGGSDSKFNVSGALGGVVNIITVKKQKPGWRFGGSAANTSAMPGEYRGRDGQTQSPHWEDLADTQNYSLSAAYGSATGSGVFSFASNLFANRAQNHFLFKDYADYTRRKDNNEALDTGANVSAVWELPDFSKIIASLNFYYGDKNFPISGFSSHYGNQKDFSTRQSLMLDAPRAFHNDLAAEVSLSYNFGRLDYSPPLDVSSRHNQHNLNAINRWSWFPSERLTLRSGADYRFIFLDSTEIGIRDRHDGGIYLAAEYSPVKRLMFIPSVKAVFTSGSAADTAAIPKLGILWNVTDSAHPAGALAVKNNYFRSFKFPDFEELYWTGAGGIGNTGGNPDLLPEDGWGGDIGAEWQVNNYVKLESVFFTQWIKNSIHWYSGNSGSWRPENVGEAIFFGLDNKLGFEIPISRGPFKKIVPSLSYKYLRSYLLSFGYTVNSNKRIPYNPEHTIGASLDFIWGNSAASSGSFLITGYYESLRYNDRANNTALNPYFLLNATVNQKAGKNLTVFGTLRNILNTSYESFYGYPMPGITLTLGMRVNLDVNKAEKTPENFSRGDAEAQRTQRGKQ